MLKEFISQNEIVERVLTLEELLALSREKKEINLLMGQTFDDGQPLDMMKYAFFMMYMADIMSQLGIHVSANWLIADHFMVKINKDKTSEEAEAQIKKRISYLQTLNGMYGGNIGVILSSDLSSASEYQEVLKRLEYEGETNTKLRQSALQAVPKDRRNNPDALNYFFEEIATIQSTNTHIKVGPVYEMVYDGPAREFLPLFGFNKYVAVHLTKGFLFGSPNIPEELRKEIEQFGVLPYKKNSKGLGEYRIDPLNDCYEKTEELIRRTHDKRPLIDILVIAELAKQRLERKVGTSFFDNRPFSEFTQFQSIGALQNLACRYYKEYIQRPLGAI